MKPFMSMLGDPMYAAGIAAAIAIIAKWLDNRLSQNPGRFVDYLKLALYSAALVGSWVYLLQNPAQTREASRQFAAPMNFPSL